MRSWNMSWRNARRHKFAWRGSFVSNCITTKGNGKVIIRCSHVSQNGFLAFKNNPRTVVTVTYTKTTGLIRTIKKSRYSKINEPVHVKRVFITWANSEGSGMPGAVCCSLKQYMELEGASETVIWPPATGWLACTWGITNRTTLRSLFACVG